MSSENAKSVKRRVKEDSKYKNFCRAMKSNPNLKLPFDDLYEELDSMMITRKVRSLNRKSKSFTHDVLDSMIQDQQIRSRCTEMLSSCVAIETSYKETLDNLRDYLMLEYSGSLGTRSTKDERRSFFESVLKTQYKYLTKVDRLRQQATYIITDIDKAGYNYRNIVEMIKLMSNPSAEI